MKKTLAIMLALIMVLAMVPALAEGEVIHWAITKDKKLILSDKEYTGEIHPAVSAYYGCKGTIPAGSFGESPYGLNNAEIITSVEIQGSIAPTTMGRWFHKCKNLKTVDLSSIDASKLTDISHLFGKCESLESVIFPANMSSAPLEQMTSVFNGCEKLTVLDLSGWNTSKVKDMSHVFAGCKALTSLNVSGWNVSNVKDMNYIFSGCSSLTSLDLSTWNVTLGVQDNGLSYGATGMFKGCSSLAELKLGEFRIKAGELGPQNDNTTMSTFEDCSALTSLHITEIAPTIPSDVWKPNLKNMFKGCRSLKTLTVDNWDIRNITEPTNQEGMFDDCNACIVLLNVTGTPHANEIPNVTLIPNGGTMADGSLPNVTAGDALPTLVKSGHIFAGWYTNADFNEGPVTNAEAGSTYYAKWTTTKVEFLPGGGNGVMPGANLDANNTLTFPECTFTAPANKEFAGWKITEPKANADKLYQKGDSVQVLNVEPTPAPVPDNPTVWAVTVEAQWKEKPQEQQPSGGGNGGGGYWYPTTTPVPVIVIPPKTGDMTIWQSILHFFGIR